MALPTGPAVVFLFTDIEGSTRLERALGTAAAALLAEGEAMPIETVVETILGTPGPVARPEGFEPPTY